jgi:hypothetical protein
MLASAYAASNGSADCCAFLLCVMLKLAFPVESLSGLGGRIVTGVVRLIEGVSLVPIARMPANCCWDRKSRLD